MRRISTGSPFEQKIGYSRAVIDGDRVSVTPDKTFFGTMVVRYRVADATGDSDREVEARIRLTVQGKPDAPGTPVVSSVQDRTVVLSWTPPAENEDGSSLVNLAGYTIVYGPSSTTLHQSIRLENPGLSRYVIDDLPAGTYYFGIKAFNAQGVESAVSNVVSKVIR